ncbi:hydroxyproline-2-epimerase [Oleiharenicola lentus]|uniref:Hydroxyproline-2-epimerase n=1 Tax=Oleiharenicola lentus TaxID=2508720 RepID=A0A4V1M6Q1_9BACT|nr:proline racemase family protein [Oleiharenicola lentus]RXK56179.1 hydroxyproline-2-epimerase [Oleiharenicola lentus]
MAAFTQIKVLDTHTGGEPTRLVLDGGPDLGSGPLAERARRLQEKHRAFCQAVIGEPRGSDVFVGALLVEPHDQTCHFGVVFFNVSGPLSMCGHGVIGTVVALAHAGLVEPGLVRLDTPAGYIAAILGPNGEVTFDNVPAYRKEKDFTLYLPGVGDVQADLAWGGNWFCLIEKHDQRLETDNLTQLTSYCARIRQAVRDTGFPEIDHVALFGPAVRAGASSRNFVLCPSQAYDRSPCGTGTSAKLACLAADNKLAPGTEWVQESIVGSTFRAKYRRQGDKVVPTITGTAHVTADATLLLDPADPFAWGLR